MSSSNNDDSEEHPNKIVQDPISEIIGDFGPWQRKIAIIVALCLFPCTFHIFLPTFTAAKQKYWCARPPNLVDAEVSNWKYYSQPVNGCAILDLNWNTITLLDLNISPPAAKFISCSDWEFSTEAFSTTIVSEWVLVFGRKMVLIASILTQTATGIIMAFTPWFGLYLACKFFLGFACIAIIMTGLILAMEIVGGKWCVIVGVCNFFPMPIAYIMVSLVSMAVPDWRHLQLIFSLPSAIFISFWWILPESPRWLLSMGRIDDVCNVIEKAAAYNKLEHPESIRTLLQSLPSVNQENEHAPGFMDLFRGEYKKITICVAVIAATTPLLYYGLVLNIESFRGNLHTITIIFAAIEIPARLLCLYVLMKLGRRLPICIAIIISGLGCLALVIVDSITEAHWPITLLVVVSRFSICATNNAFSYYTAELYPTLLRNLGVGISQIAAGFSLICLPFIWTLPYPYPLIIMGLVGVIGGLCVLLLPETVAKKTNENKINEVKAVT